MVILLHQNTSWNEIVTIHDKQDQDCTYHCHVYCIECISVSIEDYIYRMFTRLADQTFIV